MENNRYYSSYCSSNNSQKSINKLNIPQQTKSSLMSMMKQIMQKSYLFTDQLHFIPQQSVEQSNINQSIQQPYIKQNEHNKINNQKLIGLNQNIKNSQINTKSSYNMSNSSNNNLSNNNSSNYSKPTFTPSLLYKTPTNQSLNQSSINQPNHQFSKLIQITQRCVNYYNLFLNQKNNQFQIIQKTFHDLNHNLNQAFQQIYQQLNKTHKQLQQFLIKKHNQITLLKQQQDNSLKQALNLIKQVHLAKLLSKNKKTTQQNINNSFNQFLQLSKQHIKQNKLTKQTYKSSILPKKTQQPIQFLQASQQISIQLHNYALTLNNYYILMQQIQKSNYKQMVQQSVNFINNLITQEMRITLYQKIPSKLTQKKIIRQNSRDFLLQNTNQNIQSINPNQNYHIQPKTQNFGLLDLDSFTKLFFQNDIHFDNFQINKPMNYQFKQHLNGQQIKIQKQQNLISNSLQPCSKHINIKNNIQTHSEHILSKTPNDINQYSIQSKLTQTNFTKNNPTTNFNKKQIPQKLLSPTKISNQKSSHQLIQNQLDLIKMISNQQTHRSAKIKGYLVTFQDPKLNSTQNIPINNKKISKNQNFNKSPKKIQTTPRKLSKSTQRKVLGSSNLNSLNEQKLKNSQQNSLKNSRNSVHVSQFKVGQSRKQSLVNNK